MIRPYFPGQLAGEPDYSCFRGGIRGSGKGSNGLPGHGGHRYYFPPSPRFHYGNYRFGTEKRGIQVFPQNKMPFFGRHILNQNWQSMTDIIDQDVDASPPLDYGFHHL